MTQPFVPRSARDTADEAGKRDPRRQGVPQGLVAPLAQWVRIQLSDYSLDLRRWLPSLTKLHALGLDMDFPLGDDAHDAWATLAQGLTAEHGEFFLDVVDWCLHQTQAQEDADEVERMLSAAGSVWRVGVTNNTYELIDRVEPTAEEAARTAAPPATSASVHLNRAWSACHGREKNPKTAYDEAMLAVEAAALPIVILDDKVATLGKAIKAMKAAPTKWRSPLGEHGVEAARAMMSALWKLQRRHGVTDRPVTYSQEEAEAAVQLAVTLVRWFSSGGIARVE